MQKRQWIALAGLSLTLSMAGASAAVAQDDGTGGPDQATADPSLCDRDLITEEQFAEFGVATPGYFTGTIEPVYASDLANLPAVDDATATDVTATLRSYEACVARDGLAGAYAFLSPDLESVQLVYLGVYGATLEPGSADATPVGLAPVQAAPDMTPQQIVQLEDGRVGAVVPAPQPGTDFALLTLEKTNDLWMIEDVAPLVDDGEIETGGGGGP